MSTSLHIEYYQNINATSNTLLQQPISLENGSQTTLQLYFLRNEYVKYIIFNNGLHMMINRRTNKIAYLNMERSIWQEISKPYLGLGLYINEITKKYVPAFKSHIKQLSYNNYININVKNMFEYFKTIPDDPVTNISFKYNDIVILIDLLKGREVKYNNCKLWI